MTSKQRVLLAVNHQTPDRVSINYLSNPGIDSRLKKHFGLTADDDEGLRKALNVDFRQVFPAYTGPKLHEDIPDRHINEWGIHCRWIKNESGGYWDFCDFPLKNATIEDIEKFPLPSPDDFDYQSIIYFAEKYKDYCVILGNAGIPDIINGTSMLRSMEQVLIDLMLDDPACLRLIERRVEILHEIISRSLEIAKGKIDMLWMGEDLGTQHCPLISIELFRKHIRPNHQKFIDLAKTYDIPVMVHSCGSSSWAFDDFIEMGVAAMDTLQPEAKNMQPEYLKKNFGDKLAFHGCISTAGPVAYGTVADVEKNVKETLEIMMPGGGYMLAPTHALQDNSPTKNVLKMYEAAMKYGKY
ncbi:MAG: hypothetical protein DRI44_01445 [Chlamydiae bacterium]|nr:MAG: hypothetical protein DRI44_01445 [Chlamydiota bacterium]